VFFAYFHTRKDEFIKLKHSEKFLGILGAYGATSADELTAQQRKDFITEIEQARKEIK
jgi:hypothetical protein